MKKINFDDLHWEKSYSPWKAYCQSKLADLMLMLELGRRSDAAGIGLLSNSAHPGWARTNLQVSGPGKPESVIAKLAASFMSQDAANGALPTLRVATATDSASGTFYAPDKMFGLKGDLVPVPVPKPALDEAAARRLWELSEQITGVRWPLETTPPGALRSYSASFS